MLKLSTPDALATTAHRGGSTGDEVRYPHKGGVADSLLSDSENFEIRMNFERMLRNAQVDNICVLYDQKYLILLCSYLR